MAPMTEHEHTVDGRPVRHSHEALPPEARARVRTIPHEARAAAIAEARRRFGGIDVPASLTGMLVAIGLIVVIGGILDRRVDRLHGGGGDRRGGGDGRRAGGRRRHALRRVPDRRVDGRTGLQVRGVAQRHADGVWFLVLMGILAVLGAWIGDRYNLFDEFVAAKAALPNWYSDQAVTAGTIGRRSAGLR